MKTLLALLLASLSPLLGAAPAHPVKASLIAESPGFRPGQSITVGLLLKTESHWHTYWRDPGDAGLATTLSLELPAGLKASEILWPKPKVFKDPGGLTGYGYEGDTLLPVAIQIPASYQASTIEIKAKADWLVCKDVCIPGSAALTLTLPSTAPQPALFQAVRPSLGKNPEGYQSPASPSPVPVGAVLPNSPVRNERDARPISTPSAPKKSPSGLPQDESLKGVDFDQPTAQALTPPASKHAAPNLALMLLFAFIGGLILNLMPCVLPVLSLKVMAFVRQANEKRRRSMALGAAFSLGAIASFWALAALVIAARAAGQSVGWGFQFQSPAFVAAMAVLVTAFALNLFGVFEIYLPGKANQAFHEAGGREGLPGAFFTGAFMTLLATPCSAPFLGTALGFAFSQSSATLFLTFTAVGLGLAAPYQLLSSFPALMRWVPKPGKWMLHFRQFMGFPLLATLCWLLWVLGKQTGVEFVIWMLAFLLILALAAFLYGIWAPLGSSWARLISVTLLMLTLLGAGYRLLLQKPFEQALAPLTTPSEGWEPYDLAHMEVLKKQGRIVFVDYTAEWCWTCKVNERVTLNNEKVIEAFKKYGVAKMKADWTRKDPAITAALSAFGRSGVPFYAFYSSKLAEPLTLAEVITPDMVLDALAKLN
jgi:thiol:disulfide interchange protein